MSLSESANGVWRKSTASQPNGDCLEVDSDGGAIRVRDSRDRSGAVLSFKRDDWQAFLAKARTRDFDNPQYS